MEFHDVLKFGYTVTDIEGQYKQQCQYYKLYQPTASHLSEHENKAHLFDINGYYMSIIQTLFMQLCTDSIYDSMHWLTAKDVTQFIKYDVFIVCKLQADGFVYNLGLRSNMLVTLTNCSVSNVANSRNSCSIIALIDSAEDRWTLSLMSQNLDLELMYLNILGIVCPRTGKNVGVVCTNVQDTGSLEKTFGKDRASGRFRWHLSRENSKIHHHQWFRTHVPISVDIKLADDTWRKIENDVLKRYLQSNTLLRLNESHLYLCQFSKSKSNPFIYKHMDEFKKIRQKISELKNETYGFIGNWQAAKSIWTFGTDGLHLSLRICNITIKRIILFSLEYTQYLRCNPHMIQQNHHEIDDLSNYPLLSNEQILNHFRECCQVPFSYDPKQPTRLKIKSGL